MSEGIYTGITANAKQLWFILKGKPIGATTAALGKFLYEEYEGEYPNANVEKLAEELKETFDRQGHSGGSALVAIQQLFCFLGAGVLSKAEREYMNEGETVEEIAKKPEEIVK